MIGYLLRDSKPAGRGMDFAKGGHIPAEPAGQLSVGAGNSPAESRQASLRPSAAFHDPTSAVVAATASPPCLRSCSDQGRLLIALFC